MTHIAYYILFMEKEKMRNSVLINMYAMLNWMEITSEWLVIERIFFSAGIYSSEYDVFHKSG